ncbi:MAG: alpha/beta hydrolase family protein, partial [Paramuribaculum sp.]|nr:alpha/beta hydrolase family protein [Paramuribaculum sp.]
MKKIAIGILSALLFAFTVNAQSKTQGTSTRSAVETLMRNAEPSLTLDTAMTSAQFAQWKK